MKKVFALMTLAVALSFTACGPSKENDAERKKWVEDSTKRAQDSMKTLQDAAAAPSDTTQHDDTTGGMKEDTTSHK